MKNITSVLAASIVMISGLAFTAQAAPMKHMMMAKSMTCPACHMKMMTKKTMGTPIPVKIKGTTYYCCSGCAAGKAHMTTMMSKKKSKYIYSFNGK